MHIATVALFLFVQAGEAERLIKELDHEEIERRERATEALRRLSPESFEIDRMLEALAREGTGEGAKRADQVRRHRIAARLLIDPDRVIQRLASPDANIRAVAVQALAQRGGAGAPLVRGLLQDANVAIQQTALQIMIAADNTEFLPDIRPFAEHPQLYQIVLPWLASKGDLAAAAPLRAQLNRGSFWALEHLCRLRQAEDIALLRTTLIDQPANAPHVMRAIRGWDEARTQLSREIRMLALEGLNEAILLGAGFRDADFVAGLRTLCQRESSAAAFALGSMGNREAIPYLMRLVRTKRLHAAIGLLGRLRAREAVWLFGRMLKESSPQEARDRAAYARALGDIGGPEAEDLLLVLIEDAGEEVRFEAAASLARLKCKKALPQLARALDDAVAFPRSVPPSPDAPVYELFEARSPVVEWRQGREAAVGAMASISGETREGTLDEQCAAWRAWWASRPPGK
jgi:HEAT repeat protein